MEIGRNIKKIRTSEGLTQKQLANKLNVNINTIQNYESGRRKPSTTILEEIAKILNVDIVELFGTDKYIFAGKSRLATEFANIINKKDKETSLLYEFLESKYGPENINMNRTLDGEFINFNMGNDVLIYNKEDFERFMEYVVVSFPNFKTIIDKINNKK